MALRNGRWDAALEVFAAGADCRPMHLRLVPEDAPEPLRCALLGSWSLTRHIALAPRCNKVCVCVCVCVCTCVCVCARVYFA